MNNKLKNKIDILITLYGMGHNNYFDDGVSIYDTLLDIRRQNYRLSKQDSLYLKELIVRWKDFKQYSDILQSPIFNYDETLLTDEFKEEKFIIYDSFNQLKRIC